MHSTTIFTADASADAYFFSNHNSGINQSEEHACSTAKTCHQLQSTTLPQATRVSNHRTVLQLVYTTPIVPNQVRVISSPKSDVPKIQLPLTLPIHQFPLFKFLSSLSPARLSLSTPIQTSPPCISNNNFLAKPMFPSPINVYCIMANNSTTLPCCDTTIYLPMHYFTWQPASQGDTSPQSAISLSTNNSQTSLRK